MTAAPANPAAPESPGPDPARPDGGGDPSMEDILASIRRILNEEEPVPAPDVLELTPAMRADAPPASPQVPSPQEAPSHLVPSHVAPPHAPPAEVPAHDTLPAAPSPGEPEPPAEAPAGAGPAEAAPALVAPAAAAAAAASMGELVRRLAGTQQAAIARGGPTIEDLVREEIRGLLKAWLDENLPRIVERLVRAEIERVVGRHVG